MFTPHLAIASDSAKALAEQAKAWPFAEARACIAAVTDERG